MSYQVFTLKYRPRNFLDVVGQRSVAETLQRAVQTGRLANAYLFCGSRGTGKTSMARILAKALNCPDVVDGEPCNVCEICKAVGRGEDIDVIEIDGASNRGIDDIRGIRDGAGYAPARSRFKIYIIDEVHMLTIQAFNALLKVLEEPPPHVRFIFATTDPNNLPDTILSRCQRHEFRRIGVDDIVARMNEICLKEGIDAGDEVLRAIALKSQGGLRDSLSMLDQLVSFAGTTLRDGDLEQAIGLLPRERVEALVESIARGDVGTVIAALEGAFDSGFDSQEVLQQMLDRLRALMLWHAGGNRTPPASEARFFETMGPLIPLDRCLYLVRLFLSAEAEIKRAGQDRLQLELTALKAARSAEMLPVGEILARLEGKAPPTAPNAGLRIALPSAGAAGAPPVPAAAPRSQPTPAPRPVEPAASPSPEPAPPRAAHRRREDEAPTTTGGAIGFVDLQQRWSEITAQVKKQSAVTGQALMQARPVAVEGGRLRLEVAHGKRFIADQLSTPAAIEALRSAMLVVLGGAIPCRVDEAQSAVARGGAADRKNVYDDPVVRKFMEHFGGGVVQVENEDGEGL